MKVPEGSLQLLYDVRARFIARGTSLKAWCDANRVRTSMAWSALNGKRNGPKARAMRSRILAYLDASAARAPAQRSIRRAV